MTLVADLDAHEGHHVRQDDHDAGAEPVEEPEAEDERQKERREESAVEHSFVSHVARHERRPAARAGAEHEHDAGHDDEEMHPRRAVCAKQSEEESDEKLRDLSKGAGLG